MNKTIQNEDLRFGLTSEDSTKAIIEKYLGIALTQSSDKYAIFDYFNDETYIELKTRRVNHNQYKSLMFGYNKFKKGLEHIADGKKVYIFFKCSDGLYFWRLTDKHADEIIIGYGGRQDRGKTEIDKVVYVPTKFLTVCN